MVAALRYATGTCDMRPRAEVANTSCLQAGCHQDRLLDGESATEKWMRFRHAAHLSEARRGLQLHCTSCHGQVVQGGHVTVMKETCFLCHFKGPGRAGGGCTACHGIPEGIVRRERLTFSHDAYLESGVSCEQCHVQVAEGDGRVSQDRCFSCHVERLERYEDAQFIHDIHTAGHGVDCFRCHEQIQHGRMRMIQALEVACENCHQDLHSPQKELYLGSGGAGVPDTPSRMFLAQVRCDGCHTQKALVGVPESDQAVLEAQRQACVTCHGKGYDRMLDDWRRGLDQLVRELGTEMERAEAELQRGAARSETRVLVEQARRNYDLVRLGRGVHNVDYALALLRAAVGYLDQAMPRLRPGYQAVVRSPLLTTPDGSCAPLCHNSLGLPERLRFDQLEFPHRRHVEAEVFCTQCHPPDQHRMKVIARAECSACHHRLPEVACSPCHPLQEALYSGKVAGWGVEPDVMAAEEVSCQDCHGLPVSRSIPVIQKRCVECHEPGYGGMLHEWIGQVQEGLARAGLLAREAEECLATARKQKRNIAAAEELVAHAAGLIELVEKGKGAHNLALSLKLLRQSEAQLRQALEQLETASVPAVAGKAVPADAPPAR